MSDFSDQSPEQILESITDKHPVAYLMLSAHLLNEENYEDATAWFYVGQIRFRTYLVANPELDPSGDPALFAALMESIGTPINEYAGGDIDFWISSIEKALTWHDENDDGFLGKAKHQEVYAEITTGLIEMKEEISASRDEIMKQRIANGLENRSR